jgi:hypothetical protein
VRRHLKAIVALSALLSSLALATSPAGASPPALTIDPVSEVQTTKAHVSGTVDADEVFSEWWYELSTDGGSSWIRSNVSGFAAGPDPEAAEGTLEGLSAGQAYQVRLAAFNFDEFITEASEAKEFTTDPAPIAPIATLDPAASVAYTTAQISGQIDPEGGNEEDSGAYVAIHWTLQLSESGDPGSFNDVASGDLTGAEAESEDPIEVPISPAELTNLTPNHTYSYRLIATYAGQSVQSAETVTTLEVAQPTISDFAVSELTATTAHFSAKVNPNGTDPAFQTTWSFECTPICPNLQGGTIEPVEADEEVASDTDQLEPNTPYTVTLKASNLGGTSEASESFQTPTAPPLLKLLAAGPLHETDATLKGRVNPRNSATTWWFEWGTADCASNPCAMAPATKQNAGEGGEYVNVKAPLTGLSPSTTYFYRLLAENQAGQTVSASRSFTTPALPTSCPNEILRAGASAHLPDCRAYEMVSPLAKNGGNIAAYPAATRVAADGDGVVYGSPTAFAGAPGSNDVGSLYLGRRGAEGWSVKGITPQHETLSIPTTRAPSGFEGAFSADLSKGVFRSNSPLPGLTTENVTGVANLYLGSGLAGQNSSMQLISDSFQTLPVDNSGFNTAYNPAIGFASASADFSHIAFESTYNLTADASGENRKAYEWSDGEVRLAGILPDSACASPPCPAAESVIGAGAAWGFVGGGNGTFTQQAHAVSEDGSRAFFTVGSLAPFTPFHSGDIYVRENGATTLQIDADERTNPPPGESGESVFQRATPDGSKVFFLSTKHLTDEDDDGSDDRDLYEYDANAPAGEHLTLRTPELFPQDAFPRRYAHVFGASDDGAFVYFLAKAPEGSSAPQGLYVLHSGVVRLIGVKDEVPTVGERGAYDLSGFSQGSVSPDGRHVLFASYDDQGQGYDQQRAPAAPACALSGERDESVGGHCKELYLYSYDSDSLVCASCNPSGARPSGDASFVASRDEIRNDYSNLPQPLSDDGRYVFFDSRDPLVPQDSNGKIDVYAYDSKRNDIALISTGQCNCDTYFQGASPDGEDVFIVTKEQLVLIDSDTLFDIYDARIGGGIASQNRPPAQECEGDACQSAPIAPLRPTPASAGLNGPGNPTAHRKRRARCAKGKQRVKRRCVKRGAHGHKAKRNQGRPR